LVDLSDLPFTPHPRYLIDLDGLDPITMAPFACSGLTAFSALKRVEAGFKDGPLLVIGAGGLGLICLEILKAMGGNGAIVADIDPVKREAAKKSGALAVFDPRAPDALAQLTAANGPITAAIDFVGSPETSGLAFAALGRAGKLLMVGLFGGAAGWSLPLIPIKAVSILGSYVQQSRRIARARRSRTRWQSQTAAGHSLRLARRRSSAEQFARRTFYRPRCANALKAE
jgi:propanol-preferring alcohol dehydrogenase